VDGYSSCGKSTFARDIAALLGYVYIDSGAMYRAVTWDAINLGILNRAGLDKQKLFERLPGLEIRIVKDEATDAFRTLLNGKDIEDRIRTIAVSNHVSEISAIREVREHMVRQQRQLAGHSGVVMDGRDIGTVVFPNADIKIFMTASPDVRAQRRYKELREKGMNVSLDEVLKNIMERDRFDSEREISPLRMAEDAILLDNSNMTVEEQLIWFKQLLENAGTNKHE
jgi:CMP/dCMP kinase